MKTKTNVKASAGCDKRGCGHNHNETQMRACSLRVKTGGKNQDPQPKGP